MNIPTPSADKRGIAYAMVVLFAINTLNFFDRQILGAVGEPIRKEFELSDASLGLLGTAFTLLYAFVGLPLGALADKIGRKGILSVGVFVWSLLTAASGLAQNFWQIFVLRLGVGVGEASCAPAATSLIGDLFPSSWRSKAMSIFMLGLPVGVALSFAVSGTVAKQYGWRAAFLIAGLPGLICAIAMLFVREPERGAAEQHNVGVRMRSGSPYWNLLKSPTMRWIIISGAVHNFNMYAIGAFITPYLMRYHALDIQQANLVSMLVYGVMGAPGLLLGGYIGDLAMKKRTNGRMLLGAVAIILSVPATFFALSVEIGGTTLFLLLMGLACGLMYFYYSTVYATIQDITEPGIRGKAMAVYFFAMYVLGASLGPYATGLLSDHFTKKAAALAGVTEVSQAALEPFRAVGLQNAMYVIPVLGIILTVVLLLAARTTTQEINGMREWMKNAAAE